MPMASNSNSGMTAFVLAGVMRLEAIWCGLRRQDIFPVTLRPHAG